MVPGAHDATVAWAHDPWSLGLWSHSHAHFWPGLMYSAGGAGAVKSLQLHGGDLRRALTDGYVFMVRAALTWEHDPSWATLP